MKTAWLLCVLLVAGAATAQTSRLVRVDSSDPERTAARLRHDGFDVLRASARSGVQLVVSPAEAARLEQLGLAPVVLAEGRPYARIAAEQGPDPSGPGEGSVPASYPDLAAIEAELFAQELAHPGLCRVVDLTATYGAPATFEGRHILAVKISDGVDLDEDEPATLLVSAHHSREIVTPVIALDVIERLLDGYGSDPRITAVVDENEIWIVPVWNPDGYEYVFDVDNFWRKNRRPFFLGTGVDLNRNYPFGWDAFCGGSSSTSSSTYKGPDPASESETQAMLLLSADRRFAKVLDVHSSGREVRSGYGCANHPLDAFHDDEAEALAALMNYDTGSSCCLGGDIHWHMAMTASLALLLETATEFQPSYGSALQEADRTWPGTLAFFERPASVAGHVTDACTNLPLAASLENLDLNFTNGEVNGSGGAFGRYHAFLPAGTYDLRFSAPGYVSTTVSLDVSAGATTAFDLALTPVAPAGCWQDLGFALAGSQGLPTLLGTGTLEGDSPAGLELAGAHPNGATWLLFGFSTLFAPFKGGTLVPTAEVVKGPLALGPEGDKSLAFTWPVGVPSGFVTYVQFWIADPAGPAGFSASNGISATAP